jgi:hypothetical protein
MLQGRYRDTVTDRRGRRIFETPYRPNLVVDGAFALLAALLKREPAMEGILYWAVGAGDASWDERRPAPDPRTARLLAEVDRREVPREAIRYAGAHGTDDAEPSTDLEIRLTFEWPDEDVTLREFGLFGGAASRRPGTGILINHVIHGRIDLVRGQRLSRQLRLSFGRWADRRWLDVADHWAAETSVLRVDGVGTELSRALATAGITTVGALARVDPFEGVDGIATIPLLELRAKARLAIRTAAEVHPPRELHERTVSEVLRLDPSELAREAGTAQDEVVRLREQLATLELALNHHFVGRLTVAAVAGAGL